MKTYIVELKIEGGHEVLGYSHTLKHAKDILISYGDLIESTSILMINGDSFGEGYHQYRLVPWGTGYKRFKDSINMNRY